MTLASLRDDALSSTPDGFRLLLSLPWIRSLPLWSLGELAVAVDGIAVSDLQYERTGGAGGITDLASLAGESSWWHLQVPLVLRSSRRLEPGAHRVEVSFRLTVPYLEAGPDAPLSLPFRCVRALTLDAIRVPGARTAPSGSGPVGDLSERATPPEGWTLAASAFNWTPDVIRADRAGADIAVDIVAGGTAEVIELEPGQLWPSFPEVTAVEGDELRMRLDAVGGSVSIVGASLDDWASRLRRRTDDERIEFLLPQLRNAKDVGAHGVRLPAGQAGPALLEQLLPVLRDLDLVLYEEVQGQQAPSSPSHAAAYDTIAEFDDPHLRLLVDISMLMPALPVSYLERLEAGGIDSDLLMRSANEWKDPATQDAVFAMLRASKVPPELHALYMDMVVRFGRSDAADLRGILPLVGAFHLKFWDLDDADGRVSRPIRELGAELAASGFSGTLCSEWGGHEWLDADATDITRRHLALARAALSEGASQAAASPVRRATAGR